MKNAEKIVKEARDRLNEAWLHDRDNRREAARDLAFLAGDQWPEDAKREREAEGRPMLTFNRLPQFVNQVTNDIKQADFSIKVTPVDDKSDPEIARIYDGLMRQIQFHSKAQHVFGNSVQHSASCGIGWHRIVTDYTDDTTFDQEIKIKRVVNPLSVYCDPAAVEPDRSDAGWMFVTEMWPKSYFKENYPDAMDVDVEVPREYNDGETLFWQTSDTIRVAEYYRKMSYQKTLVLLEDGTTIDKSEISEMQEVYAPPTIVSERQVACYRVEHYLVTGAEVLEGPTAWPGKYIPLVPVMGAEIPLEEKVVRHGVIRFARDPQQMYNYYRTASTEAIANQPKAPWLATPKMIGKFKAMWNSANNKNRPYLLYEPDDKAPGGRPLREAPPPVPTALVQESMQAADDMKGTTGIYDAGLGNQSNETSGVAITARDKQGDTANYHYADNLEFSLHHTGKILIDLIPKVYDNERVIRILGDDNKAEQFVPINAVQMHDDGQPVMINDLSTARFDIRTKIGPSHSTKREEAAASMEAFGRSYPDAMPMIADLMVENLDWPGADQIAKRLKAMVPEEIREAAEQKDDGEPQEPPPPDPMEEMQQEMAIEGAQAEVAEAVAKAQAAQATARKIKLEADEIEARLEADKIGAETRKTEVETAKLISGESEQHHSHLP